MVAIIDSTTEQVTVRVELFGLARMIAERREFGLSIPRNADSQDIARALASACPPLLGSVLLSDGSGLLDSYTLNVNGTAFVSEAPLDLAPGDSILLFSSQAGG